MLFFYEGENIFFSDFEASDERHTDEGVGQIVLLRLRQKKDARRVNAMDLHSA
jgi:hypothetical protein